MISKTFIEKLLNMCDEHRSQAIHNFADEYAERHDDWDYEGHYKDAQITVYIALRQAQLNMEVA